MRKSRFTEEQIVTAVKEHKAGTPTQELCRRLGVGPTLYRWKANYGGMAERRWKLVTETTSSYTT